MIKNLLKINLAPQAYVTLLELLRPLLSKQTKEALKVFSSNRNKWKAFVDSRMDSHQFPDLD